MKRILGAVVVLIFAATLMAWPAQSANVSSATVTFSIVAKDRAHLDQKADALLTDLDPSATWTITYTDIRPSLIHGTDKTYTVSTWAADVEATS